MQEDHNSSHEPTQNGDLKISSKMKDLLAEIAKWAKIVSIVGFFIGGILLIVAFSLVFMGGAMTEQMKSMGQPTTVINSTTGVVYAIIAVIYYFLAKYIYDFAVYMQQAVQHNDQESIEYSFDRLRAFFKFISVAAIVAIGFYVFALIISVLMGGSVGG